MPTLAENIAEERGTETPDRMLGPLRLARRKLLHGEALLPRVFSEEARCSHSVVSQAAVDLGHLGFEVVRVKERREGKDGRATNEVRFSLANPAHVPTAEAYEAERARRSDVAAVKNARTRSKQEAKRKDAERKRAERAAKGAEVEVAERTTAAATNHAAAADLPALPALGTSVVVYAQVLNEDGSLTLGLRNGKASWMTTITGVAEK